MNNSDPRDHNSTLSVASSVLGKVDIRNEAREASSNDGAFPIKPRTSILYSNAEDTIFMVDVPASIVRAQSSHDQLTSPLHLLSCPAPVAPYSSTEPKSEKARSKLLDRLGHSAAHLELHDEYSRLIVDALDHLAKHLMPAGSKAQLFCLPRAVKVEAKASDNIGKRKVEEESMKIHEANHASSRLKLLQNHKESKFQDTKECTTLPPLSSVLLGLINTSISTLSSFHTACLAHPTATNGRFPLVVLDAPWPNKSVSRSSSYATSPTLVELIETLQGLGLEEHLAENGYVACWVTNKAAIRDAVIGTGGLFDAWGLQLVEEWIWCKITANGEPVTDVNGIWRKPYEACLIGKRIGSANKQRTVKRRVILGVPDLHSRKPCLKELAQRLLLKKDDGKESHCAGLELFARYAVAGWMSWGLEATKYNHEDCWTEGAEISGAD